ncbi:thioredoxin reductase (NADPH) [Saccharopolyspora lacisalsi]|uniref:Thioredoxin reductase (NADPH) n=1 Tax=Halosaccharopolyspora lacisalsi TaxID=1000566 RepID=A0A839DRP8_9PSEU|nr:NAD(P)/FAD-dependent oxidoreductase [Halosaccharopolyspora lacisalsi]MBA8824662.1 thioredoxin reductase (NADPH) [Halosaccharopolyspora lacisalsi]
MEYDAIVVGGGAAGLAAATMLARSRRRVVVVDAGEPRNAPSAHLHGFLSRDGSSPSELLAAGRREVTGYGGQLLQDRVRDIGHIDEHGYLVRLDGGGELTTRGVLVATGLRDVLPDIPGVRERWGNDVLHCPYCHGYEVRDAPIAVVGGDNRPFTLHQASLVRQWSDDVVFFPHTITLTEEERERLLARGIHIVDGDVARVATDGGRLSGVECADGRVVRREAVFVGPRFVPHDELLTGLGCALGDDGWVVTDTTGRTSVDGIWAAGNVVDSPAQLSNAAGAGSTAATALNHRLLADDVERALTDHRAAHLG